VKHRRKDRVRCPSGRCSPEVSAEDTLQIGHAPPEWRAGDQHRKNLAQVVSWLKREVSKFYPAVGGYRGLKVVAWLWQGWSRHWDRIDRYLLGGAAVLLHKPGPQSVVAVRSWLGNEAGDLMSTI
jgi:hypothetical protein